MFKDCEIVEELVHHLMTITHRVLTPQFALKILFGATNPDTIEEVSIKDQEERKSGKSDRPASGRGVSVGSRVSMPGRGSVK